MRTLVRLAWRNLRRNRRRTGLTVGLVAVATWAMVALWGLADGSLSSMIRAQTRLDTGDLQLHPAGYLDDPDLERAFSPERLAQLTAALEARAQVRALSPRLTLEGLLQSAYASQGVNVRGLDPALEGRVTELDRHVIAGRFLAGRGEIVLGQRLAERLDVRLGERVVLQVQGLRRPRSRGFRLVGVVQTGLAPLDRLTAFVTLADARDLTEVPGATELAVAVRAGVVPQDLDRALKGAWQDVEVSTFFDLNPLIGASLKIQTFESLFWMGLIALLAGFGVANTVTFTVLERVREFGVLLALGLRPRQLRGLVVIESALLSGMGFVLGALAGYGMNLYLQRVGIDLGAYADAFPDLGLPTVIYAQASWRHGVYACLIVVLTALVAARYPARRAANLEPTEAMRYV